MCGNAALLDLRRPCATVPGTAVGSGTARGTSTRTTTRPGSRRAISPRSSRGAATTSRPIAGGRAPGRTTESSGGLEDPSAERRGHELDGELAGGVLAVEDRV